MHFYPAETNCLSPMLLLRVCIHWSKLNKIYCFKHSDLFSVPRCSGYLFGKVGKAAALALGGSLLIVQVSQYNMC